MRSLALAASAGLSFIVLLVGCAEPDLGLAPFLCNPGQPQCPSGYTCVKQGGIERCLKEGTTTLPDAGRPDAAVADAPQYPDWPQLPDRRMPDTVGPKWDGRPDTLPTPDKGSDGFPPHLGCQSHNECKQSDPSTPCCCPFILGVWTCLPLCMNPICF